MRIGSRGLFECRPNIPSSIWNPFWLNSGLIALRKLVGLHLLSNLLEFQTVIRSPFFRTCIFSPSFLPFPAFLLFHSFLLPLFLLVLLSLYLFSLHPIYLFFNYSFISSLFLSSLVLHFFFPSLLTHPPPSGPTFLFNPPTGRIPACLSKWHVQFFFRFSHTSAQQIETVFLTQVFIPN